MSKAVRKFLKYTPKQATCQKCENLRPGPPYPRFYELIVLIWPTKLPCSQPVRTKEIHMKHLEEALDRVIAPKKTKLITEKEKEITAYHEMGHTLVAFPQPL